MRSGFRCFAVAACMLVAAAFAAADQITGDATGLSNPTTIITFDENGVYSEKTPITTQFSSEGATFLGFGWDNATLGQSGSTGFQGGDLANGFIGWPSGQMTISFASTVNAAAFAAVDQNNGYIIQAYLGSTLVDSMTLTIPGNPGIGYVGFKNENFSSITITPGPSSFSPAFSIDNLQYISGALTSPTDPGSVPEPASIIYFGSGMASVVAVLYRKRNKA